LSRVTSPSNSKRTTSPGSLAEARPHRFTISELEDSGNAAHGGSILQHPFHRQGFHRAADPPAALISASSAESSTINIRNICLSPYFCHSHISAPTIFLPRARTPFHGVHLVPAASLLAKILPNIILSPFAPRVRVRNSKKRLA
jgi:hypothetical protein